MKFSPEQLMKATTTEKKYSDNTLSLPQNLMKLFLKIFKFLSKGTLHSKPHSSDLLRTKS